MWRGEGGGRKRLGRRSERLRGDKGLRGEGLRRRGEGGRGRQGSLFFDLGNEVKNGLFFLFRLFSRRRGLSGTFF